MFKKILAATALSLALAGPVLAQPVVQSLHVAIADVNTQTESGARTLLARIDHAARTVCGPAPESREISEQSRFRTCVSEAKANAVNSLNLPMVQAIYNNQPLPVMQSSAQ
jgi:UrcA family protein